MSMPKYMALTSPGDDSLWPGSGFRGDQLLRLCGDGRYVVVAQFSADSRELMGRVARLLNDSEERKGEVPHE